MTTRTTHKHHFKEYTPTANGMDDGNAPGWNPDPTFNGPATQPQEGRGAVYVTDAIVAARLVEANSLLRSTHSIAERHGENTYWEPFTKKLHNELALELPIVNALNGVVVPDHAAVLVFPDGETYGLTIDQARRAVSAALEPDSKGVSEAAVETALATVLGYKPRAEFDDMLRPFKVSEIRKNVRALLAAMEAGNG